VDESPEVWGTGGWGKREWVDGFSKRAAGYISVAGGFL
jgi:hypothetical protein